MSPSRRWIVTILALAGLAAAGTAVVRHRAAKDDGGVRTEVVGRGAVAATVTSTGTISAVHTVQVGSQVSGIVQGLLVDYNSPVTKGQLLASLDPTPFQAQVEQRRADLLRAEVDMRNTEIAFNRQQRLLEQGLTAPSDYDTAKAAFDAAKAGVAQAQATLRQAQTNLSYTKIFSPIDGVVVARQYDIGQTVAASFQAPTLFTIAEDLTKMQVAADVDQSDIGRVQVGQTAHFTVDAYADETFSGTISQIRLNATQNQNVVTYPVIIDVPNPDKRLKPLMTADVTIEVAKIGDVLRVPNAALRFKPVETGRGAGAPGPDGARASMSESPRGGGAAGGGPAAMAGMLKSARPAQGRSENVYVVDDEGKTHAVAVKTGITDGRYTAIVGGDLKEGDRVAVGLETAKSTMTGSFPGMGGPGGGTRRGGGRGM
ncbi:MAG TPA: efflux RND transporter periplasmic adaptor subunit [Candidatus Polarisedimenticolia bacterium]|nr:efflux RND transporter periplasmic adaptor subunit [Candidatus Polarisedimenticolia bacterium]